MPGDVSKVAGGTKGCPNRVQTRTSAGATAMSCLIGRHKLVADPVMWQGFCGDLAGAVGLGQRVPRQTNLKEKNETPASFLCNRRSIKGRGADQRTDR